MSSDTAEYLRIFHRGPKACNSAETGTHNAATYAIRNSSVSFIDLGHDLFAQLLAPEEGKYDALVVPILGDMLSGIIHDELLLWVKGDLPKS